MPIHLGDRDIKSSPKHVLLGLVIGVSVVAVFHYLEPESATCELCREVAKAACERCISDAAAQNDGPLDLPQKIVADCYNKTSSPVFDSPDSDTCVRLSNFRRRA